MGRLLQVVLLSTALAAQDPPLTVAQDLVAKRAEARRTHEKARALLEQATTDANSLPAPLRTYSLVNISQGYVRFDKDKAIATLEDAYAGSEAIEDTDLRERQQTGVLFALFQAKPDLAAQKWESAPEHVRNANANLMLKYRLDHRDLAGATDVVYRTVSDNAFPFLIAAQVIERLPEDMVVERQRMFMSAFEFSKAHPRQTRVGLEDFGTLILRTWRSLPPKLLGEAIDLLLEQAQKAPPEVITVGDARRTTRFSSTYEYRLFQMLPLIRQLDRERARSLVEQLPTVLQTEKLHPNGILPAVLEDDKTRGSAPTRPSYITYSLPGSSNATPEADLVRQEVSARTAEIERMAVSRPRAAVREASVFPEIVAQRPYGFLPRMNALAGLARIFPEQPDVAAEVIDHIYRNAPRVPLDSREAFIEIAMNLAIQIKDRERMLAGIDLGLKVAEALYKEDSDADDPNQEMKAYWPSTASWQRFIFVAAKHAPETVPDNLQAIKDDEIKGLCRIAVVLSDVGVERLQVSWRVKKKSKAPRS